MRFEKGRIGEALERALLKKLCFGWLGRKGPGWLGMKESRRRREACWKAGERDREGERPVRIEIKSRGDRAKRQRGRKSRVRWESSVNGRGSEPEKLNKAERPIENK